MIKSPAQGGKVCKNKMKTTINHETKVIKVIFPKKSAMPKGRDEFAAKKRILAENGLTLMSGYAIYFDYEKTEKQLTAIARKFDSRVANDIEVIEWSEKDFTDDERVEFMDRQHNQRYAQAGSSLRK